MAEKQTTTVTEEDINLDTLLAAPGADSILLPGEKDENVKNSIFSRKPVDLTFLDKPESKKEGKSEEILAAEAELEKQEAIKNAEKTDKINPVTNEELDNLDNDEEDEGGKRPGAKKLDKNGLYEMTKKLIEKKMLVPFEDEKPLEDYTLADYEELYEANDAEKSRKLQSEVPTQFFNSLPDKLKYAAKYVADGGQDLAGLFGALAESERVATLDPKDEDNAEAIARQYLQSTWKDSTPEEIEEEIISWKDHGELEAKATKFKPKLDALKEEYVAYKVQEQEQIRKQQVEQSQAYMKNVYEVLEPGELNGIKLDKKVQGLIYSGLTQPNYQSISGKQTNLLGHLLEKYQWVEPRHDLIAEALWLLADPEGYKNKLKETGKKEVITDTVRKLKTVEKDKIASTIIDEEESGNSGKSKGLKRPSGNSFFKR